MQLHVAQQTQSSHSLLNLSPGFTNTRNQTEKKCHPKLLVNHIYTYKSRKIFTQLGSGTSHLALLCPNQYLIKFGANARCPTRSCGSGRPSTAFLRDSPVDSLPQSPPLPFPPLFWSIQFGTDGRCPTRSCGSVLEFSSAVQNID